MVFTSDDETARHLYLRIAERHIHKDRILVTDIDSFWKCFDYAVRRVISHSELNAINARM